MSHPSNFKNKIIVCLCLTLITGAVFGVAVTHDFVNYDDRDYVIENHRLQAGLSLRMVIWAFTTILHDHNHWHPLTLLSHMLDFQLFGLNPAGHHFTSILLHILNTILLFLLLERMTKALWRSVFAAALFALHPLHVEAVAWISSRKDVLSTFFLLLTLWVYVSYTERPGIGKYLLALGLFAAGLLSKSMLVTLPCVMLLLDYWPLGRLSVVVSGKNEKRSSSLQWKGHLLWEKLPFFLLSTLVGAIAILARQSRSTGIFAGARAGNDALSDGFSDAVAFAGLGGMHSSLRYLEGLIQDLIGAANGYALYIWKMFFPNNLSIVYVQIDPVLNWQFILSFVLLAGISLICFRNFKGHPYLLVGWLWFLGTLVPVSGIFERGPHLSSDRYTYMSFIGLFIMLSWGVFETSEEIFKGKRVAFIVMALFLAIFSVLSFKQVRHWKDGIALFSNAVAVNPNNTVALVNLGLAFQKAGNNNEAIKYLDRAVQLFPESAMTQCGLGYVYFKMGQYQKAIDYFSEAIRVNPSHVEAYMQLAASLARSGSFDKAREYYIEAIKLNPHNPRTYYNYSNTLALEKKDGEALDQIKKALDIEPNFGLAQKKLSIYLEHGIMLYEDGKLQEAEELLKDVVRRFPKQSEAYLYLGLIASSEGQADSAISYLHNAIKADPRYAEAYVNLGINLAGKKEYAQAEKAFSDALKIEPNHVKAHYNYAVSLYLQHRHEEAMVQLAKTLEIDPDYKKARDMLYALRGTNIE